MAAIKGLNIPITATYDGKGVKSAESSIGALESQARKLVKTFTGLFAAEKLISFGKAAVDAFAADQKASYELTNTLSNLGVAFDSVKVDNYISKLSELYGITKDKLDPAFANLIRFTRDVASAQSLMQTALDVSAGTGKDLQAVTTALGRAYSGNTTALARLGIGLSSAQLKSNSFAQNMKILNALFHGDANAAALSYQGTMDRLKNTVHDASVEIGGSLVNAFTALAGAGSSSFNWIKTLGDDISSVVYGATKLVISIKDVLNPVQWIKGPSAILNNLTKDQANLAVQFNKTLVPYKEGLGLTRSDAIAKATITKTASQNLAIQKQITTQTQAQLAAEKAKQVLTGAGAVTDLQQIQLQAALAQTNDFQTQQRLQLQEDLLNGNATAAGALAQQILAANAQALQSQQIDPYGKWSQGAADALANIKALQAQLATAGASTYMITPETQAQSAAALDLANADAATVISQTETLLANQQPANYAAYASPWQFGGSGAGVVQVQISFDSSGNPIANLQNGLNQQTANGSSNSVTRVNPLG
jgi:hypothetical protein